MNKTVKKYILAFLMVMLNGFACALQMKGSVGVGAWDGVAKSISAITLIKVGTVTIFLNSTCIIGEMILDKQMPKLKHLLQFIIATCLGSVVNLFVYQIFTFELNSYILRLLFHICGVCLSGIGCGVLMAVDVVSFPLEAFCMSVNRVNSKLEFSKVRQMVDVVSIITCIILAFIFRFEITIREGTIIAALIFAPIMAKTIKITKPYIEKM